MIVESRRRATVSAGKVLGWRQNPGFQQTKNYAISAALRRLASFHALKAHPRLVLAPLRAPAVKANESLDHAARRTLSGMSYLLATGRRLPFFFGRRSASTWIWHCLSYGIQPCFTQ